MSLGYRHTPEARAKISFAARNRTEQQRANLSASLRGRALSDAHRESISRGSKGKPKSAAMKSRLSASLRNRDPKVRAAAAKKLRGALNPSWKGGTYLSGGYRFILASGHPYANRNGYVREHRLVMERVLGRYLLPIEVVHHENGDRLDNRACNLLLCCSQSEHLRRYPATVGLERALRTIRRLAPQLLVAEA